LAVCVPERELNMDSTGLTSLLDRLHGGDAGAFGRVAERVYDDFRAIAYNALEKEGAGDERRGSDGTLGVTMVAHDAMMELKQQRAGFVNRDQFFALATRFMFRIIAHHRRDGEAAKRGGGARPVSLNEAVAPPAKFEGPEAGEMSRFLDAMSALHEAHPEAAEVVTLHGHGRIPLERAATLMGLPLRTVERRWKMARAYLKMWPNVDGERS